jgi:hypothetical protein
MKPLSLMKYHYYINYLKCLWTLRMQASVHSRTQSPSYARSTERDEGLWPNPYQTGIWLATTKVIVLIPDIENNTWVRGNTRFISSVETMYFSVYYINKIQWKTIKRPWQCVLQQMIFSHVKISYFLRVFKYDFSQWPKSLYNTYVYIINILLPCFYDIRFWIWLEPLVVRKKGSGYENGLCV